MNSTLAHFVTTISHILLVTFLVSGTARADDASLTLRAADDCGGDCQQAIQDAIDSLASQNEGGTLFLQGYFDLDGGIVLKSHVSIVGLGRAILQRTTGSASTDVMFSKESTKDLVNVTIDNIEGDGSRSGTGLRNFLFLDQGTGTKKIENLEIRNTFIHDFEEVGIKVGNTNNSGVLEMKNLRFVHNHLKNVDDGMVLFDQGTAYNANHGPIHVRDNLFEAIGNPGEVIEGVGFGVTIAGVEGVDISGNRFSDVCEDVIRVTYCHNATIRGNTIEDLQAVGCNDSGGVKANNSGNVSIIGNTINGRSAGVIEVLGGNDVSIVGNNIDESTGPGIVVWNSVEREVVRVTISSNNIINTLEGILVNQRTWSGEGGDKGIEYIVIAGNNTKKVCRGVQTLDDNPGNAGNIRWVTIQGNVLFADRGGCTASKGIDAAGSGNFVIVGNAVKGGIINWVTPSILKSNGNW